MRKLDRFKVRFHALRLARRLGVARDDPRVRELEDDALVLVGEGASPRHAVEWASVPIFRLYGQPRATPG